MIVNSIYKGWTDLCLHDSVLHDCDCLVIGAFEHKRDKMYIAPLLSRSRLLSPQFEQNMHFQSSEPEKNIGFKCMKQKYI
jgi:hypothetical protein